MPGHRLLSEIHAQIKVLSEEQYSTCEIACRLNIVSHKTVVRSIKNFINTREYRFKKPTGHSKNTTK